MAGHLTAGQLYLDRGPTYTFGQDSDGPRRLNPPAGHDSPRIRGCSGLVASDSCHTCRHNRSSGASEDEEVFSRGCAPGLSSKGGRQNSTSETLPQDKVGSTDPTGEASSGRPASGLDSCDTYRLLQLRRKHEGAGGYRRTAGAVPARGQVGSLGWPAGHRARATHPNNPARHRTGGTAAWEDALSRLKSQMLTPGGCFCDIHDQLMAALEEVL